MHDAELLGVRLTGRMGMMMMMVMMKSRWERNEKCIPQDENGCQVRKRAAHG
jgi:hypothetical protein